jgi:hypothetical protein
MMIFSWNSGIYVVLFGMSAHVMRRSSISRTSYDLFALIALFVVATIAFLCDLLGTAGSFYNNFKLGGISAPMNALEARKFDHGMMCVSLISLFFNVFLTKNIQICYSDRICYCQVSIYMPIQ